MNEVDFVKKEEGAMDTDCEGTGLFLPCMASYLSLLFDYAETLM